MVHDDGSGYKIQLLVWLLRFIRTFVRNGFWYFTLLLIISLRKYDGKQEKNE